MTFWLLRGLRKGVVTTGYPDSIEPSTSDLPSPPTFDVDRLSDDLVDALIAVCPSNAFRREGREFVYDVGACTRCGLCLEVAGDAARPSGITELAARRREDLVHTAQLGKEGS